MHRPQAAADSPAGPSTAPSGATPPIARSRSSISIASTISITPSQADGSYDRHIMVAIDNSNNSKHALEWALQNLYRHGDKFHLVHIIPEPPTLHPWPGVYIPPDDALEREEFKEAATMVRAAFAPLVKRLRVPCDVHLIVAADDPGSISNILLDRQQDLMAEAMVVAPHGKSGLQEWWLGSTTKGLLRHATVPVVVVVPPSH